MTLRARVVRRSEQIGCGRDRCERGLLAVTQEEGAVPEDAGFCFQTDAVFLCVPSTWANRCSSRVGTVVWGRS